jgi:F0F1-type ATP synthase membrane subunit b/b'
MGLKDSLDKGLDAVKHAAENVKDSLSEAGHRSAAEAEQTKRDVAGDDMTLGEKAGSIVNQGSETVKAELDAAKREARSGV